MVSNMNYSAIQGTLYLKQSYQKNMVIALLVGVTLHLSALGSYLFLSGMEVVAPPVGGPVIHVGPVDLPTFPTAPSDPIIGPIEIARPTIPLIGIPEPVDDFDGDAVDPGALARSADIQIFDRIIVGPGGDGGSGYGSIDVRIPGVGLAPPIDSFFYVDRDPEHIYLETPVYPEMARRAGFEATLVIRVLVDVEGNPIKAVIMKSSSTNVGFEQAAIDAALKGKWTPALVNDNPVMCWVSYTVVFSLD
ncbi:MAG: energy transducer TonB [candidate division Zixibacteria bacterium]|nr:energy transducer TonB [candidate division Zixibacteria bacterium]MBU1471232.1 energy transducer TonB [candidate division Zixibacteria bacterium]MBU2624934.1 energy transducer TonB [candidate division Zixibacteria bacterium]